MNEGETLSTRIKISAIFIVLVISLFFLPAKWFGLSDNKIKPTTKSSLLGAQTENGLELLSAQEITQKIEDDTDGDGLSNWQESLWGTDMSNADTDNDGTPDGEETKNGRDPKIPAPNDKLFDAVNSKDPATVSALKILNDPNNLTSQTAKNIMTATALLKGENIPKDQLVSTIIGSINDEVAKALQPKVYTVSDLKISKTGTVGELKIYGNNVGKIILYISDQLPIKNDLIILDDYAKNQDANVLKKFEVKVKVLKEILSDLIKNTSVPQKAIDAHLFYINSLENYISVLDNISKTKDDPVRGVMAFKNYQTSTDNLTLSVKKFSEFFDKENVIFSSKEFGYLFTYYIINNNQ